MEASRATTAASPLALAGVRQVLADYATLTKPKVQSLLLLTTVATMYVAGDPSVGLVLATCLGGYLSAGGAGPVTPGWPWARRGCLCSRWRSERSTCGSPSRPSC